MSRLAEIRARVAAASSPWTMETFVDQGEGRVVGGPLKHIRVSTPVSGLHGFITKEQRDADACFIASSPKDTAYLLARLDEAVALLQRVDRAMHEDAPSQLVYDVGRFIESVEE